MGDKTGNWLASVIDPFGGSCHGLFGGSDRNSNSRPLVIIRVATRSGGLQREFQRLSMDQDSGRSRDMSGSLAKSASVGLNDSTNGGRWKGGKQSPGGGGSCLDGQRWIVSEGFDFRDIKVWVA